MIKVPNFSDFKRMRTLDGAGTPYAFVDKSLLIRDMLDSGDATILFARPRRFGKTTNLSMLYYYFSCTEKETACLFNGLKIQQTGEAYTQHQGAYPTVFITLKHAVGDSFSIACEYLASVMARCYRQFDYLLDGKVLNAHEINRFNRILAKQAPEDELALSLGQLTEWLRNYHDKEAIVLIDEYDAPIHAAYFSGNSGYFDKMLQLMSNFLGSALKDNKYIYKGVITGILQIAKSSIFSGLNNIEPYTFLDEEYTEYFGFTEEEVVQLFQKMNATVDMEVVKAWYNGYHVGDNVLYNPKSILSFMGRKGGPACYWVDTGSDKQLRRLIENAGTDLTEQLATLLQGEGLTSRLDKTMLFEDLGHSGTATLSLLYMAGYVNATPQKTSEIDDDGPTYNLRIPNKEVKQGLRRIIIRWLGGHKQIDWLIESVGYLKLGDVPAFSERLQQIAYNFFSCHDAGGRDGENFYHGFLLCLTLFVGDDYSVQSNREAGKGRPDIMLLPKETKKGLRGIILELKRTQDANQLPKLAEAAYQQIEDKKYHLQPGGGENVKSWLKVGIAFAGKEVQLFSKESSINPVLCSL